MYYIYVYLDPRRKGCFCYDGTNVSFLYEPFYIGQGKLPKRMNEHIRQAKNTSKQTHMLNKIRKIIADGYEPIRFHMLDDMTLENADANEINLISKIGRMKLKQGPLVNITEGGSSNHYQLASTRQKIGWSNRKENCSAERINKLKEAGKRSTTKWQKGMIRIGRPGASNPAAKQFILIEPTGIKHILRGNLKSFLNERGYKPWSFFMSLKTNKPISRGPAKGWQLFSPIHQQ